MLQPDPRLIKTVTEQEQHLEWKRLDDVAQSAEYMTSMYFRIVLPNEPPDKSSLPLTNICGGATAPPQVLQASLDSHLFGLQLWISMSSQYTVFQANNFTPFNLNYAIDRNVLLIRSEVNRVLPPDAFTESHFNNGGNVIVGRGDILLHGRSITRLFYVLQKKLQGPEMVQLQKQVQAHAQKLTQKIVPTKPLPGMSASVSKYAASKYVLKRAPLAEKVNVGKYNYSSSASKLQSKAPEKLTPAPAASLDRPYINNLSNTSRMLRVLEARATSRENLRRRLVSSATNGALSAVPPQPTKSTLQSRSSAAAPQASTSVGSGPSEKPLGPNPTLPSTLQSQILIEEPANAWKLNTEWILQNFDSLNPDHERNYSRTMVLPGRDYPLYMKLRDKAIEDEEQEQQRQRTKRKRGCSGEQASEPCVQKQLRYALIQDETDVRTASDYFNALNAIREYNTALNSERKVLSSWLRHHNTEHQKKLEERYAKQQQGGGSEEESDDE